MGLLCEGLFWTFACLALPLPCPLVVCEVGEFIQLCAWDFRVEIVQCWFRAWRRWNAEGLRFSGFCVSGLLLCCAVL